jgi:DNA ligase-1
MTWIAFARLNQAIEELSPTAAITQVRRSWDVFENKELVVSLFTKEYPGNNLGQKTAIKWLSSFYEVFDGEIETYADMYGDLGEGIYFFDESGEDSTLTLEQVYSLICMDCSKIGSDSFTRFSAAFEDMSALEKKWFVKYWTQKIRHGFGKGTTVKLLASIYGKKQKEVKRHAMFNTLTNVAACYIAGEEPSTTLTHGLFIAPMLAKAIPKSKWPREKVIEYKYDGARYQIHREEDEVIIFNRKGVVVTNQFTDVRDIVKEWETKRFIIDTEIYPVREDGSPDKFQKMNVRFHSKDHDKAIRRCPVELAVFDTLMIEGDSLIDLPLKDRLKRGEGFPNQAVREVMPKNSIPFYSKAISGGFEGIMVKDLNAPYEAGKRSVKWAKYKPPQIELDIVITGARFGDGKRSHVYASFDMAVSDNEGGFIEIGAIGTGFSDADFMLLTQRLRPTVNDLLNDTYRVPPRIVLQVKSDLVTQNENGTYGLRFPRMVRIRDDKPVSQINTIDELKGMV